MPKLDVPEDKLVTTLYIGNLADRVSEKDLKYVGCRKVSAVSRERKCAGDYNK